MFGVFFASLGTFFEEVATVVGKKEILKHEESPFTMGFFNLIWGVIFLCFLVLIQKTDFVFSQASVPTFLVRVVFEMLQAYATVLAIAGADRSTTSFVRVGTIPLLLAVDTLLGYSLQMPQLVGIGIVLVAILFVMYSRSTNKQGVGLVLFTTVNAVITISLYKYNITHFNSVAGEQIPMGILLLLFMFGMAHFVGKENPIKMLRKGIFMGQSVAMGFGSILESFAYVFAPASVILAAKRSSAVLWSVLSGNHYFHERHMAAKLAVVLVLIAGIVFLAA